MIRHKLFPVVGICMIVLGLLAAFHVFLTDISRNAGIGISIAGLLILGYSFSRKS